MNNAMNNNNHKNNNYTPKNILITGGAGFIGCNHVRFLLKNDTNINIINLDKLTYAGSLNNLQDLPNPSHHIFIQGDICNQTLVDKILRQYQIDTIIHFAAESHVDRSIAGPAEFVQTNVIGTFTLLEAARQYWLQELNLDFHQCRFHHISTDEVYGSLKPTDPAFNEQTPYSPNSPYSATKAGSDHMVRAYHHTYGFPVTVSNCSNNYGPHQFHEKFIPTVIKSCLENIPIPIYGNGSNIRDWLYVEDHCRAIDLIIRQGRVGETYNIGGCAEHSNLEVVQLICHQMDAQYPENATHNKLIQFVKDRLGHDWRYAMDISKIQRELGWKPLISFDKGLRDTINWYIQRMMVNV